MLRININKKITISLLLIVFGLSVAFLQRLPHSGAQTGDYVPCSSYGIILAEPLADEILSGTTNFSVIIPTGSTPYPVNSVTYYLNEPPSIGSTLSGSNNGNLWEISFDTRSVANGDYNSFAKVHFQTAVVPYGCYTDWKHININNGNSTSGSLNLGLNMYSWHGPTNSNIGFMAATAYTSGSGNTDVSGAASYEWTTTIGYIKPSGRSASFSSGPVAGKGIVTVRASYGGLQKTATIAIEVFPASDSTVTTYPTVAELQDTSGMNPGSPLASVTQGDNELEACLKHVIGEENYQTYVMSGQRFSFNDLYRFEQCFAKRRFVIPATLAPIAPEKVKTLPIAEHVTKIESFKTITVNGKQVIHISGTGQPGETVIIYIFSEPMVLVAKADGNGKWSYILEDPLESGDHEAYVTVEDDANTQVRSGAYVFGIASTAPSDVNPLGLSLLTKKKDPIALYIGTGAGVVSIGGAVLMFIIRRRRKLRLAGSTGSDTNQTTTQEIRK